MEEIKLCVLTSEEIPETAKIKEKLETTETYFLFWLGDYRVTSDSLNSLIRKLYNGDKPRFTDKELQTNYSSWTLRTFGKTIYPLIEAFLNINFGNPGIVPENVAWVEKLTQHCVNSNIFSSAYAEGITYLSHLVKIHASLTLAKVDTSDYQLFQSLSYDKLGNKGKAVVLLAKVILNRIFDGRLNDSVKTLKEIVILDSDHWLWRWELHQRLKEIRNRKKILLPDDEDINAVIRASEFSISTEYHSMCLSELCNDVLVAILRHRVENDLQESSLSVGNTAFNSNSEIVEFIKTNARKALECKKSALQAYIIQDYEFTFSQDLPFQFIDLSLAKECQSVYLKMMHDYGDGNLVNKKLLEGHKKVYLTSIRRMCVLLKSVDKYSEKLDELFSSVWEHEKSWMAHELYTLHFLHGCYFSIKGDIENALLHWLKMDFSSCTKEDLSPSFVFIDFAYLLRIKIYFNWPENVKLNLDQALEEIEIRQCRNDTTQQEQSELKMLKIKVERAMKVDLQSSADGEIKNERNLMDGNDEKKFLSGSQTLIKQLDNCETYFRYWLDGFTFSKEKLISTTKQLYFFESSPPHYLTEESLKRNFYDFNKSTLQIIINLLVEAFLNIDFGNIDLVAKNMSWIQCALKSCKKQSIFSVEYADGIKYLCDLVQLEANLNSLHSEEADISLSTTSSFDSLTNKGKSIIYFAKWTLYNFIPEKEEEFSSILKEMVNLDSKMWLWHWNLFECLKDVRIENKVMRPSDKEINACVNSMENSVNTKYHAMCVLEFCKTLASVLTDQNKKCLTNNEITTGCLTYKSNEDAVAFIKTQARKSLQENYTYKELKRIHEYSTVLSESLPPPLQDLDMAYELEDVYLKLIHVNANGEERFIRDQNEIYRALITRIQNYLKLHDENSDRLERIFTMVWNNVEVWEDHEEYSLHFFNGCYFFRRVDIKKALGQWLQMNFYTNFNAEAAEFLYIDFASLFRIKKRNKWTLDLNEVQKVISEELSRTETNASQKEKLKFLQMKVENAMKVDIDCNQDFPMLLADIKETALVILPKDAYSATNENTVAMQDALDLKSKLEACKNYFISWMDGYKVDKERFASMTSGLYKISGPPDTLTCDQLERRFTEFTEMTLQRVIEPLVEAFLNIPYGNIDLVAKNISWVEFVTDHCTEEDIFPLEYAKGVKYLCSIVKVHTNLVLGTANKADYDLFSSCLFDTLPNQGKTMVLLAKWTLENLTARKDEESDNILKEMIKLDSKYFMWSWKLYRKLHTTRKNKKLPPTEEEIDAISIAMELSRNTKYHCRCAVEFCRLLAELVTGRVQSSHPNTAVDIGNKHFNSNEEIVGFIKRAARETLKIRDTFLGAMALETFALLFHVGLPFQLQDLELYKECLNASSKTMAMLKKFENDEVEGILKLRPENYEAMIITIQKLLQSPKKNTGKLEEIFGTNWKQLGNWKEYQIYSLRFLYGFYFLMKEGITNALEEWLAMELYSGPLLDDTTFLCLDFSVLPRIRIYFEWFGDAEAFSLQKVREEILKRLSSSAISPSDRTQLKLLNIKLGNAIKMDYLIFSDNQDNKPMPIDINVEQFEIMTEGTHHQNIEDLKASPESVTTLQTKLGACHNYFIDWLKDCTVITENVVSMTSSLYNTVSMPHQLTEEQIKKRFSEYDMLTLQTVVAPVVEAALNMLCGNLDLAMRNISWVEYVIKYCVEQDIFSEEYAKGIKYLCDLAIVHANLKFETVTEAVVEKFNNCRFENLTEKGKSMVFLSKWMLNEQIPDRKYSAVNDLKEVALLDSSNWNWHYLLCSRLRFTRRQDRFAPPDEDEVYAIARAVEHSVSDPSYHPMCVAGLCQSLAEIIKYKFHQKLPDSPVTVGSKEFKSSKEVVDYINAEARNSFKAILIRFAEAIRYGEIFSSLLPHKYHDYDLAEKCYKLCLEMMPSNSKANHRMGTLQLTGIENIKQAIYYFKRAVECEPKNFPAWMDYIQTLLGSHNENKDEIDEAFKTISKNETHFSSSNIYSVRFLEACYFTMQGEVPKAVSHWAIHNSVMPSSDRIAGFSEMRRVQKRYKWRNSSYMDFDKIHDEFERQIKSASPDMEKKLKLLKVRVENEIFRKGCRFNDSTTDGYANTSRQHNNWQSRSTVADKVSNWRASNAANTDSHNNGSNPPNYSKPPANKYVPPHRR